MFEWSNSKYFKELNKLEEEIARGIVEGEEAYIDLFEKKKNIDSIHT